MSQRPDGVDDAPFEPSLAVAVDEDLRLAFGAGVDGPDTEVRRLDDIRSSLPHPDVTGPDALYGIAMDVARAHDRAVLEKARLLFGIVAFAPGTIGDTPVRSQGHVHAVTPRSGWSPPEMFQIWRGSAVILMQETAQDDPGRCYAVHASPGEIVVTPPGWAHAAINADPSRPLVFGAWCDRDYAGFEYADVRHHRGLAWTPTVGGDGGLIWHANAAYVRRPLEERGPRETLGFQAGRCIYRQAIERPDLGACVPHPDRCEAYWRDFEP